MLLGVNVIVRPCGFSGPRRGWKGEDWNSSRCPFHAPGCHVENTGGGRGVLLAESVPMGRSGIMTPGGWSGLGSTPEALLPPCVDPENSVLFSTERLPFHSKKV